MLALLAHGRERSGETRQQGSREREHAWRTGQIIGVKAAGGVSTTKQAMHMLVLVKETLGDAWLTPDLFRIGASTLANDLLMQLAKESSGRYQNEDYFTKD